MLDIRNLHKSYGSKTIVDNWNYYFANGKIYGLIGRNGIGKTTILKCICGLLSPETVKIYSERGDLSKEDYLNRDIVYVSDEAIYFYINRLHLKEYIDYYPSALSKGTLQRMMLVMAFLRKKANLLLDEPFWYGSFDTFIWNN